MSVAATLSEAQREDADGDAAFSSDASLLPGATSGCNPSPEERHSTFNRPRRCPDNGGRRSFSRSGSSRYCYNAPRMLRVRQAERALTIPLTGRARRPPAQFGTPVPACPTVRHAGRHYVINTFIRFPDPTGHHASKQRFNAKPETILTAADAMPSYALAPAARVMTPRVAAGGMSLRR